MWMRSVPASPIIDEGGSWDPMQDSSSSEKEPVVIDEGSSGTAEGSG
jgi:hypothetical protein